MVLPAALKKEREKEPLVIAKGVTPVKLPVMLPNLNRFPDKEKAILLVDGFEQGFRIPSTSHWVPYSIKNLRSTGQHPRVVSNKLAEEVLLGHRSGPFISPLFPDLIVLPLVVPNKEPNKFQLIHHLSFA